MNKVFIVDDEPSARNGLREYIDWAQYNCQVVGEAEDGVKALKAIGELQPDIVFTDVKMPNMDGVTLANRLHEMSDKIKIIFISGYDDLKFLKGAFKVAAVDYILKPVDLDEVEKVLGKVAGILKEEQQRSDLLRGMDQKLLQSMPLLQSRFFTTLIRDECVVDEAFLERMRFLDISFDMKGAFSALVVSPDNAEAAFEISNERDYQRASFAILNICQEIVEANAAGYAFETKRGEYTCILNLESAEEKESQTIITISNQIRDALEKYFHLSVTIGVGDVVDKIENLRFSYSEASNAAEQKFFIGKNQTIAMDVQAGNGKTAYHYEFSLSDKLKQCLKNGDYENAAVHLNQFFDSLKQSNTLTSQYVKSLCLNLLLLPSQVLWENQMGSGEYEANDQEKVELFFKKDTIEEMKEFLCSEYQRVCGLIAGNRNTRQNSMITLIKNVIEKNYHKSITIQDIAEEVYLSCTYLSVLFKQETGQTVVEYLTQLRMEKAKELLKDPTVKFYDICYRVGYTEPSYFSKLFKKHTGMTMSQYREQL